MANGTLRGSFSVGGGPTQYKGYKAKPKPTTTTTSIRPIKTTTSVPPTAGAMPKVKPKVKKVTPPTTTTTSVKPKGLFGSVGSRSKANKEALEY